MLYQNEKTRNISFPLGGIGSGSIGLAGTGELRDWEIFNRPNRNSKNCYSHFAIKANYKGKNLVKVLQGSEDDLYKYYPRRGDSGAPMASMVGFPRFRNVDFDGEFPIANLHFTDKDFPAKVKLCAFNPFIPHDDFNSSLPVAFFEWEIENVTDEEIEYAIAFSVQNVAKKGFNKEISKDNMQGLYFGCADLGEDEIGYTDLCLLTDSDDVATRMCWHRETGPKDSIRTYWYDFMQQKRLQQFVYTDMTEKDHGTADHGTVASYVSVKPHEKKKIRFVLAWNVPNYYNYWMPYKDENGKDVTWKNYYATQFKTSFESATYALERFDELYTKTEKFKNALFNSTLPSFVIDAISANLSILKSSTVLRTDDGTLWGWEGVHETFGSCEGSCQHVWNYAYAVPFLFPKLERSIRESFTKYAMNEFGSTCFRVSLPFGRPPVSPIAARPDLTYFACLDGQMGEVFKHYREWKISGDDEWMKANAENVFKMVEFAWSKENPNAWDADKDGVLEGLQHHTLDIELIGPCSWLEGMYLLALDCAAEIAEWLGDKARVTEYRDLYEKGKKWMNENLFNGEYFTQKIDLKDKSLIDKFNLPNYWNEETGEIRYQIGDGCIIDQMLAEWHAHIIGRPMLFDEDKKKIALRSLYKYNYKESMRDVTNFWRVFAYNDESGTIICEYPEGVYRPMNPMNYNEEVMTGFEYALAGLMLAEGFNQEGETMVKAVRDRYDGEKRNPFSEVECGINYARAMASYALLPIYSGFTFDMTKKYVGFNPEKQADAQYLWSVAQSWGTVYFEKNTCRFAVENAPISLQSFGLPSGKSATELKIDGKAVSFTQDGDRLYFKEQAIAKELYVAF